MFTGGNPVLLGSGVDLEDMGPRAEDRLLPAGEREKEREREREKERERLHKYRKYQVNPIALSESQHVNLQLIKKMIKGN